MRLPFRFLMKRRLTVRLHVDLGFQHGRLADLVQFLAHSDLIITDIQPDRSLYHIGMPERSTEVTFLARNAKQKSEILRELCAIGFDAREISRLPS